MTTVAELDPEKLAYFEAKYRSFSDDQLEEVAERIHELADEAAEAVRRAFASRGQAMPSPAWADMGPKELSEKERAEQTKLSVELWNSRLAQRVQYLFWAQGVMFAGALLGPQGLHFGALWLVLVAATLGWAARKAGRTYTRNVCRVADKSLEEKRRTLRNASIALWPALFVAAMLGIMVANIIK